MTMPHGTSSLSSPQYITYTYTASGFSCIWGTLRLTINYHDLEGDCKRAPHLFVQSVYLGWMGIYTKVTFFFLHAACVLFCIVSVAIGHTVWTDKQDGVELKKVANNRLEGLNVTQDRDDTYSSTSAGDLLSETVALSTGSRWSLARKLLDIVVTPEN